MKLFSVLPSFLFVLLVGTSSALAGNTFDVEEWKSSFASAVRKNDTIAIRKLINFKELEKIAVPTCIDCDSKNKLSEARRLFDKEQYKKAEVLYNKIPKNSDYWLSAVEERGWSHFQRDDYEKALAQTKTLLSPQFVSIISSEAFFLQSLSQLKICDYEGILNSHRLFKEKQRDRISEMQNLSKTGFNDSLKEIINNLNRFPLRFQDFGAALEKLPSLVYRDIEFQKNILRIKVTQAALSVLPKDSHMRLYKKLNTLNTQATARLHARVKELATIETVKNAKMIQKLNLIEVEAIQRIHTDMKLSDEMYKKGQFKKTNEDQLVFMDDGQPWIDELDKYDVAATACARNIRRKM